MKSILSFIVLFICISGLNAQKNDLSRFESAIIEHIKPIQFEDEVVGYYMISYLDKIEKDTYLYSATFFDIELNETNTYSFNFSSTGKIKEIAYNGKFLCIMYTDTKFKVGLQTKQIVYFDIIDNNGKNIKTNQITIDSETYTGYSMMYSNPSLRRQMLHSLKNKGFALCYNTDGRNATAFKTEIYNNEGVLQCSKNEIFIKFLGPIFVTETFNDKEIRSTGITMSFYDFNSPDTKLFESICVSNESEYTFPLEIVKSPIDSNEIYLLEAKFKWVPSKKSKDRDFYNNPISYNLKSVDQKGKIISEYQIEGRLKDTYSASVGKMGKIECPNEIFQLRKAVFNKDGILFIGDKFKEDKTIEYKTYKLSNTLEIQESKSITSKLNQGRSIMATVNAVYSHRFGYFPIGAETGYEDLSMKSVRFTDELPFLKGINSTNSNTNLLYFVPGNSKKNIVGDEKGLYNFTLESVGVNSSNEYIHSKLDFDLSSNYYQILPAKPGYVCIFEYFEKEKKIDFRLEKFDF